MAKNAVLGLMDEVSKKPGITELIINRPDNVFVEKDGELIRLDVKFSEEEIEDFCTEVARNNCRDFGRGTPVMDGTLQDGSRVNLIHKDYTGSSHAITIRRYLSTIESLSQSPDIFGLSPQWIEFLKFLAKAKLNIVVSGGTGVGKTTLLNLLLQEVPPKERIISIEDTRELQIKHSNAVRLEARPSFGEIKGLSVQELLKNTLRMRPDRIIVGEVRGGEVFDLLQAMNTGHEGSMTTVHSNSPGECLTRLENLFMLSGHDSPLRAIRYQISSAVDFIVQIKKDKHGKRIISHITEVTTMEGDRILMQDLGALKEGEFHSTGLVPACFPRLQKAGLPKNFFVAS